MNNRFEQDGSAIYNNNKKGIKHFGLPKMKQEKRNARWVVKGFTPKGEIIGTSISNLFYLSIHS